MSALEQRPSYRGGESLSTLQHWAKFVAQMHREHPTKRFTFRGDRTADGVYTLEVATIRDRPSASGRVALARLPAWERRQVSSVAARRRALEGMRGEVLGDLRRLREREHAARLRSRPIPYERSIWTAVL
jgi:hypothetical protein